MFCEDVRQEQTGQASLIGAWMASGRVSTPGPTTLLRLAVIVWFVVPAGEPVAAAKVTIRLLDGQVEELPIEGERFALPPTAGPEATRMAVTAVVQLQMIQVPHPGRIEVFVDADGERYQAGALAFDFLNPQAGTTEAMAPSPAPKAPKRRRRKAS